MNPSESDWIGDGPDEGPLLAGLRDLRGELVVSRQNSRASSERGPAAHENQRKAFATGPEAREAALSLHQALNMPTPVAVNAAFVDRTLNHVDHRYSTRHGAIVTRNGRGRSTA
jgi:hypothetical protein